MARRRLRSSSSNGIWSAASCLGHSPLHIIITIAMIMKVMMTIMTMMSMVIIVMLMMMIKVNMINVTIFKIILQGVFSLVPPKKVNVWKP